MNNTLLKNKVEKINKRMGFEDLIIGVNQRVAYLDGMLPSWDDYIHVGSTVGAINGIRGVVNNSYYPGKKNKEKEKGSKKQIGKVDVVIVGGGVVGCSITRFLSKYKLKVALIEKAEDVACGATKANNAMVHTGIGEKMGTLKQKLCVEGHVMYETLTKELNVPYTKQGMLIVLSKDTLSNTKIPMFAASFICKRII